MTNQLERLREVVGKMTPEPWGNVIEALLDEVETWRRVCGDMYTYDQRSTRCLHRKQTATDAAIESALPEVE